MPRYPDILPPPDSYLDFKSRTRVLRCVLGASENSGGRTGLHNMEVGGSVLSKHQVYFGNMAEDWDLNDMSQSHRAYAVEVYQKCGLWAEDEGDHIHVQGLPPGEGRMP